MFVARHDEYAKITPFPNHIPYFIVVSTEEIPTNLDVAVWTYRT